MVKYKYKIGDLVDFLIGNDWSTKEYTGIIVDIIHTDQKTARLYQCYGQVTQESYWIVESRIKFVEEKWKHFEDEFVNR